VFTWGQQISSEQLLAMKLSAWRGELDEADALMVLLAERGGQPPPAWTATIGSLPEPFFAVAWADRPGFTRDLCLNESPEPLRLHNIFAPPNFLMMA